MKGHPLARIEQVEGTVCLLGASGKIPLKGGEELLRGQSLQTSGEMSRAVLSYPDHSRVDVHPGSELRDFQDEGSKRFFLAQGAIRAVVSKQPKDQPILFGTPHGVAKVLGTILRLLVDPDPKGSTRLEVEEGRVEFRTPSGKSVQVEGGHYILALAGHDLAPRKLEPAPLPGWKNVTGQVGGEAWGFGGVCLLAVVPGRDELIAGVGGSWLWTTTDGGLSWRKLGGEGREPIRNEPYQLLFDPRDTRTFWVSGIRGPGIYRTQDGGQSFRRLGKLEGVDGLAVDFNDPARRTMLATVHRADRGLYLSTDQGRTWERIGDRLPTSRALPSEAVILDSKTYLVNSTWEGEVRAIYRSQDAGKTWAKVSDVDPHGPLLEATDGTLLWQGLYGTGLFRSVDRGVTWSTLGGPVKTNLIEIPGGRLVGAGNQQLFISTNGGTGWEKLGDPAPIKPESVVYCPLRRAFFIQRSTPQKVPDAVFRWDLPN